MTSSSSRKSRPAEAVYEHPPCGAADDRQRAHGQWTRNSALDPALSRTRIGSLLGWRDVERRKATRTRGPSWPTTGEDVSEPMQQLPHARQGDRVGPDLSLLQAVVGARMAHALRARADEVLAAGDPIPPRCSRSTRDVRMPNLRLSHQRSGGHRVVPRAAQQLAMRAGPGASAARTITVTGPDQRRPTGRLFLCCASTPESVRS